VHNIFAEFLLSMVSLLSVLITLQYNHN
jgi:hypothetical protein